jgi:hypothetical protein
MSRSYDFLASGDVAGRSDGFVFLTSVDPAAGALAAVWSAETASGAAPDSFWSDLVAALTAETGGAPAAVAPSHAVDAAFVAVVVAVVAPAGGLGLAPLAVGDAPAPVDGGAAASLAAAHATMASAATVGAGAFTGRGKAVVVIDDGFSWSYDQSATVYAYDFSGRNDANAAQNTLFSHGSWVAQVVTQAAVDVDIIHLKVFADRSGSAMLSDIEEALRWVVRNGEAWDVAAVNMSLGFGNTNSAARTILSDEIAALDRMGVFTIAAAGNSWAGREGVSVLAADSNVIAVSATNDVGAFASFSQRSRTLTDIAADGVGFRIETVDGRFGFVSGTSFAAPYVAAAAAVLQQAAETVIGERLTDDEFLHILQASGDAVAGAPAARGYKVADIDAAVDWFLDNAHLFGTPVDLVA